MSIKAAQAALRKVAIIFPMRSDVTESASSGLDFAMHEVPAVLLEASGLTKRYAGVAALDAVSLALRAGEVHALIGENGAGKSTLIDVLTGALAGDGGSVRWCGQPVRFASPAQAARAGIAVIHQEPQLIASMSALDNLFVGEPFPTWPGTPFIARTEMRRRAHEASVALGFELPLSAPVAALSATERTLLALLRCMMREPELLILDEPTAALTSRDAQSLLDTVDAMRRRGKAVLYVSHRLDEVLRIADRVTVLRNGRNAALLGVAGQTHASLVAAMSGQGAASSAAPSQAVRRGPVLLDVHDLASADRRVRSASLALHEGELLGVYGLAGSGRTELLETLAGLRPRAAGNTTLAGAAYAPDGTRQAAARGVVLVPEDRRGHALWLGMRVRENLTLPFLSRFARLTWIDRRRERVAAGVAMQALDVKATGSEQTVVELSGGNQQKLVFARAMAMQPKLLLCDEPTQAVDVATRSAIHRLLRAHRASGGAALLVISDLDEMLELADRIVVLRDGCTAASLVNDGLGAADVLRWCFAPEAMAS